MSVRVTLHHPFKSLQSAHANSALWVVKDGTLRFEMPARPWWLMPLIPALKKQRQTYLWIWGQPGLQMSSRTATAVTQRNPVSKNNNNNNRTNKKIWKAVRLQSELHHYIPCPGSAKQMSRTFSPVLRALGGSAAIFLLQKSEGSLYSIECRSDQGLPFPSWSSQLEDLTWTLASPVSSHRWWKWRCIVFTKPCFRASCCVSLSSLGPCRLHTVCKSL